MAEATAIAASGSKRLAVTICVMMATLMQALDSTIANVALPYMQGSLATTSSQVNWVLTSYIVAAAILTPATGWLEERFGRRPLFIICVAGFVIASMLCGTATSIEQMVIYRMLQGAFGAPVVPLAQAVLLDSYSARMRGQAMAVFGLGVMLGPILGPTLGGWLTQYYDWRWVFYVNVPLGVMTLLLAFGFLEGKKGSSLARLDWLGFATLGLAIAALQLFLDRGEQLNWFDSTEIKTEFILTILGIYLFIVHTVTARKPFLDKRLFADRNFVMGQVLIFVIGAVLLATLSLLAPYLERLMGYSVLMAGLVLAPRGVGTMVAMVLVGRLTSVVDIKYLLLTGLALTAVALHQMSMFTPDVSQSTIIWSGIIQGFGLGFVFVPLSTITFVTLPADLHTQGTGFFSLMRNVGSSVGISVTTFLLSQNAAIVHAGLTNDISPYSRAAQHFSSAVHLDTLAGKAMLNELITVQAETIAYADNFRLMMYITILTMPLVFFLRHTKPQKTSSAGKAVTAQ
ncbi:DHA2 family efflux MFS transporter permease subunit [Brucella sp. 6810]|uniref:DHA2 family efflux MFS transporter permease subunit n=1 Tax=Brucella TaxID=234 RepID=UPI000871027F|nr:MULTISPECIES: DHA2 family efflux MFS transporter permease subunit [Brucella]QNQ62601.1 DHA2 family efflux MFS transporter permease subunit [Brucella sp. 6810]SCD24070.1 Bcr/CflA subfamily drug resistance transporter [Brucella inopinata]